MYDEATVTEHLRHAVFSKPDEFPVGRRWPGPKVQSRANRDLAFLAWCAGNFQPRWEGDDGRKLLPTPGGAVQPGIQHGCFDQEWVNRTWLPEAIAAQAAFFAFIDGCHEANKAEASGVVVG